MLLISNTLPILTRHKGIAYFEEAIKRDPTFAPAYVGLAIAHSYLSTVFIGAPPAMERAKVVSAVRKALELDPELAEAHVLLASIQMEQWQWTEAEAEYLMTHLILTAAATAEI